MLQQLSLGIAPSSEENGALATELSIACMALSYLIFGRVSRAGV
jgi:hypothetical protein